MSSPSEVMAALNKSGGVWCPDSGLYIIRDPFADPNEPGRDFLTGIAPAQDLATRNDKPVSGLDPEMLDEIVYCQGGPLKCDQRRAVELGSLWERFNVPGAGQHRICDLGWKEVDNPVQPGATSDICVRNPEFEALVGSVSAQKWCPADVDSVAHALDAALAGSSYAATRDDAANISRAASPKHEQKDTNHGELKKWVSFTINRRFLRETGFSKPEAPSYNVSIPRDALGKLSVVGDGVTTATLVAKGKQIISSRSSDDVTIRMPADRVCELELGYGEGRWCTMKVDFATVAQAVIAARREWVEAHSSGRSETGVRDPATVPSTADTLAGLDQALSARTRGDGAAQERATRQARP